MPAVAMISRSPRQEEPLLCTHTFTNTHASKQQQEVEEQILSHGCLWNAATLCLGSPEQHTTVTIDHSGTGHFHNQPFKLLLALTSSLDLILCVFLDAAFHCGWREFFHVVASGHQQSVSWPLGMLVLEGTAGLSPAGPCLLSVWLVTSSEPASFQHSTICSPPLWNSTCRYYEKWIWSWLTSAYILQICLGGPW